MPRHTEDNSSDSDYDIFAYVKPTKRRKAVNDDSADVLGNFDDEKREQIFAGTYEEPPALQNKNKDHKKLSQKPVDSNEEEAASSEDSASSEEDEQDEHTNEADSNADSESNAATDTDDESAEFEAAAAAVQQQFAPIESDDEDATAAPTSDNDDDDEDSDADGEAMNNGEVNTKLTDEQLASLRRGAAKPKRHVLYVTHLNFETTKDELIEHFGGYEAVKSVRIPPKRRAAFAFVEMKDLASMKAGLELHNTMLKGREMRVQISEGGKKKSANKKNIIMQKNRKLAAMRNEDKLFTKSGKFFDKKLKQTKAREARIAKQQWNRDRKKAKGGD